MQSANHRVGHRGTVFTANQTSGSPFRNFLATVGQDWLGELGDGPTIPNQFEVFGPQKVGPASTFWGQVISGTAPLQFTIGTPFRCTSTHKGGDRLIQLQSSRLQFNWRRKQEDYPGYRKLIHEFADVYSRFKTFVKEYGIGEVIPNQWELAYADVFPKEVYWKTPTELSKCLPGLFGQLFVTDGLDLNLEQRAGRWSCEIQPKRGRLHIVAEIANDQSARNLKMIARGPVAKTASPTVEEGLELGHSTIIDAFQRVTSDEAKAHWREKK